jgi:hypothetical protein
VSARSGIVWVASYPKSGNTWVRIFLHNLVRILNGEAGDQDINDISRFSTWDLDKRRYTKVLGFEPDNAVHAADIAAARHTVHQDIVDAVEGLVFIKTHNSLLMDHGQSTVNFAVTAGAIYIVRNPLDVAISYAHHMGATIDQAIAAMSLIDAKSQGKEGAVYEITGSWSQHVESWTHAPHRALHIVRYEDMLADPDKAFASLAEHLLLKPSRRQLTKAIKRSSLANLQAQEQASGFRERSPNASANFFREGRAGQWRDVLTQKQIETIVRDHGEQMTRFEYLP